MIIAAVTIIGGFTTAIFQGVGSWAREGRGAGIGWQFEDGSEVYLTWYRLIVPAILGVLAGVCLMFGAAKEHRVGTLLFLIVHIAQIVYGFYIAIYLAYIAYTLFPGPNLFLPKIFDNPGIAHYSNYGAPILLVVVQVLNIYFWLCIFSFHQSLKRGPSNPA